MIYNLHFSHLQAPDLQNWNNWEDAPTIVTEHAGRPIDPIKQQIELYRQQRLPSSGDSDNAEDGVDFFQVK